MLLRFIQAIIDLVFRVIPQSKLSTTQIKKAKIVAHRGCHEKGLLENTIPAFDWCLAHNLWGIELDVHFTSDNIPVTNHDSHCGRIFHKRQLIIAQTEFQELRNEIPDIPSLEEVIQKFGNKIHLMIEIKTVLTSEQNNILKNLLSSLAPLEHYHILSLKLKYFDAVTFAKSTCFMPVGELNLPTFIKQAVQKKYAGVSGHYLFMNRFKTNFLRNNELKTGVGFIASKNSLIREIGRGHDWIFTDRAVSVASWMEELSEA